MTFGVRSLDAELYPLSLIPARKNSVGMVHELRYSERAMALAVALKRQKFSLESLRAGDRLLKAIKDELRKNGEKIDYNKLRRDGYSDAMIARLKEL